MLNLLLIPALSFAALLSPSGDLHKFEDVSLSSKSTASIAGRSHELTAIGEGLRYKKVVFVKARVYVGQLLSSDASLVKKDKSQILDSLSEPKAVAMQMTFLRDVDSKTVEGAFRDSFKENQVSMESDAIKQFLEAVRNGGEAKNGKTLTILGETVDGKDLISYEGTNGQVVTIEGPLGLRKQIFSLWLGKATDGGVANLQEGLLK